MPNALLTSETTHVENPFSGRLFRRMNGPANIIAHVKSVEYKILPSISIRYQQIARTLLDLNFMQRSKDDKYSYIYLEGVRKLAVLRYYCAQLFWSIIRNVYESSSGLI